MAAKERHAPRGGQAPAWPGPAKDPALAGAPGERKVRKLLRRTVAARRALADTEDALSRLANARYGLCEGLRGHHPGAVASRGTGRAVLPALPAAVRPCPPPRHGRPAGAQVRRMTTTGAAGSRPVIPRRGRTARLALAGAVSPGVRDGGDRLRAGAG